MPTLHPLSARLSTLAIAAAVGLAMTVAAAPAASAAPPSNDAFANATVVSALPYSTPVALAEATTQPSEPLLCTESDPDYSEYQYQQSNTLWYKYVSTARQTLTASGPASANFQEQINVYTGAALNALTLVGCGESQFRPVVDVQATAGTTYWFQVGKTELDDQPGTSATFALASGPALNETPAEAKPLLAPSTTTADTTHTSWVIEQPAGCELPYPEVAIVNTLWYRYTAPAAQLLTVDARSSNYDVDFAVYADAGGTPGTPLACPDVSSSGSPFEYGDKANAIVTLPVAAGSSVFIQAGGFYLDSGTLVLTLSAAANVAPKVTALSSYTGKRSGGSTITITGSGFAPGSTVAFGTTPATNVVVVSGTKITAKVPAVASARLVDVRVTTPAGTSATSVGSKYLYTK
ncbi:IPT/TIG domain-containing protein [Microbacteriaceae bacterium VKM Ac-2854]|nr:IPT/TIG domain-containing protein [Microbacteriaceae bacterium VKM Ac-2854]